MSRVLIADDHAVVRAGFKQFLEADSSINAVGEAASGNATLDALRESEWDLVLLDIHMPDRSGLDILRHIQTGHPSVRVLVMSGLPEQQYAVNVLRAGASGYLSKDSAPEELMKAACAVTDYHQSGASIALYAMGCASTVDLVECVTVSGRETLR